MGIAGIGIRPHSGWAVVVAVGARPECRVLVRRRIEVLGEGDPRQPWHEAQQLGLDPDEADALDERVFSGARAAATAGITDLLADVAAAGHQVRAVGIAGEPRDLPPAGQILRNHMLLHSAEGELYRSALTCAAAEAGLPVTCFHPKSLPMGGYAELLTRVGKEAGRPWSADHRLATVVALEALELAPPPPSNSVRTGAGTATRRTENG
jgi:hypothetical protein